MLDKFQKSGGAYISCIKINGVPILPPLITDDNRKELLKYKEQAIKIEERLAINKSVKKCLEDILNFEPLFTPASECSSSVSNVNLVESGSKLKTVSVDIEKCFENDKLIPPVNSVTSDQSECDDTHIDYLGIDSSSANIPKLKTIHLSHNIVDVSDYTNYDFVSKENSPATKTRSLSENEQNLNTTTEYLHTPKPRLIRSNSYTLDTPSPILLAHMEKQEHKLSSIKNWSSFENDVSIEQKDNKSKTQVNNTNGPSQNVITCDIPKEIDVELRDDSPQIEVVQTDVTVQQITIKNVDENDLSFYEDMINNTPINTSNSNKDITVENQLFEVLKNIPENYSKQIIELIQKQKFDQQKRLENHTKLKNQLENSRDTERDLIHTRKSGGTSSLDNSPKQPHDFSITSSQSILYSYDSEVDTLPNTPFINLVNLEYDSESDLIQKTQKSPDILIVEPEDLKNSASRELFPNMDVTRMKQIKEEWAASKIGAAVKGYLTRRLLKTEKVQSLVETIKDALLCALQLHGADHIEESDVELHRRLIQQVSAACYTFHDIFFSTSVREQMNLIATDRLRKLEKAKRPLSSSLSSRRSLSSLSTPKQRVRSLSQSKSLTKV